MASQLATLCRANLGILSQKTSLFNSLVSKHGAEQARHFYKLKCPIIGASVGQHIRHSMDHLELASILAASTDLSATTDDAPELHYDLRVRGGTLEHDMDEARKRIENTCVVLEDLSSSQDADLVFRPVKAHFFLSADESDEFGLASTIGRELGFAAHHALHHMAMIRIAALHSCELSEEDLPADFGRAPSTIQHDRATR
mmetsp:Transcript_15796/g.24575  ORF Transcript_15796/g.24575 Transcript_15796/m.24575 type:complete len:200 (+) Transcript_15796:210-809(+)